MIDKSFEDIIKKYNKKIQIIPSGYKPLLKKLPYIKAVIFDVYGTLLIQEDKASDIDNLIKNLKVMIEENRLNLKAEDLAARFREEIIKFNNERQLNNPYPETDIIRTWENIVGIEDEDILKKIALEFEMIIHNSFPSGNLAGLFNYLKDKSIKLGIISNAQFYTEILLEYFIKEKLPDAGFDPELLIYSYRYGTSKPSEKLFDEALKRLNYNGISGENVLYIGNDFTNDIIPAKKAGFRTALFTGAGSAGWSQDTSVSPDIIITDWDQIKSII
jgi:putative hydrolase of the HAD superfamily